jgi:transcriptional regulator with XRE-family HTH domain
MSDIFAERLREVRDKRGLTQVELGTKAGIPGTSIAHMEAGSRKPSFDTLRKLSKALKVSTDYLLGTTDEPKAIVGSALFRIFEKLTANDQELLQSIAAMMAERNRRGDGTHGQNEI